MKITITKPERKVYKSDFYSLDPEEHRMFFDEIEEELTKLRIEQNKKLVRPDGGSILITAIEFDPKTNTVNIITENEIFPASKIMELVKNGTLTIS